MPEIDDLKKEVTTLKEENDFYKVNGAVGLYYELNRLVNETIKYTRTTSISGLLTEGEKGDKKFERTMALIKNAKEHVLDMEEIKTKLRLTGNEEDDKRNKPFVDGIAKTRP